MNNICGMYSYAYTGTYTYGKFGNLLLYSYDFFRLYYYKQYLIRVDDELDQNARVPKCDKIIILSKSRAVFSVYLPRYYKID